MPQLPFITTRVPVDQSMTEIKKYLMDIGVDGFSHSTLKVGDVYKITINFFYEGINYQLPVIVDQIEIYLRGEFGSKHEDWYYAQAERIAARQIREHVKVIFTSAKLGMASVAELFLGFALILDKTGEQKRLGEVFNSEMLKIAQNEPLALPAPEVK